MMRRRDVHTKLQKLLHENVNSAEISETLAEGVLRGEMCRKTNPQAIPDYRPALVDKRRLYQSCGFRQILRVHRNAIICHFFTSISEALKTHHD